MEHRGPGVPGVLPRDLGAVMTPDSPIMRLADGSLWVSYYDNLFRVIDGTMHVRFRPLHQMDN